VGSPRSSSAVQQVTSHHGFVDSICSWSSLKDVPEAVDCCTFFINGDAAVTAGSSRWSLLPGRLSVCHKESIALEPAVTQLEDVVEAVEDLLVVRYGDDGRVLLNGDLPQKIHDDAGPLGIERGRRLE